MKKLCAVLLALFLLPAVSFAAPGPRGFGGGFHPPVSGPRFGGGPHFGGGPRGHWGGHGYYRGGGWWPWAVLGGLVGAAVLAQPRVYYGSPAQPLCRYSYNVYDNYGRFMYIRYANRPCGY